MLKNTCLLFIACLLLLSASVSAQDKEASPKSPENRPVLKTIPIKYADLRSIVNLLYPFNNSIRVDDRMKVLTVFGSASTIEAVEEAVKKLDVPPPPTKNVEITAYFLLAKRESSSGADLPPAVKDVVAELKNVLNYQGFTH